MTSKGEMWIFDSSCRTSQIKTDDIARSDLSYVYIILTFAHLEGWLAASLICFRVTAGCSYELCCQSFTGLRKV